MSSLGAVWTIIPSTSFFSWPIIALLELICLWWLYNKLHIHSLETCCRQHLKRLQHVRSKCLRTITPWYVSNLQPQRSSLVWVWNDLLYELEYTEESPVIKLALNYCMLLPYFIWFFFCFSVWDWVWYTRAWL